LRAAVVDIGTNSTRLLVAEVQDGRLRELERRSIVTRLGQGVDATGRLAPEAEQRVLAALDEYAHAIEDHHCDTRTAVMTSAVRDASNGARFATTVRDAYGLDAHTLTGDEEARLTFLGATASRAADDSTPLLVVDIGGGSTELVLGAGGVVSFHVSTQNGVVRHTERHIASDPPAGAELKALAADVRESLEAALPASARTTARELVAVAGTATSAAAIHLGLEPFESDRVEGHILSRGALVEIRDALAALPLEQRRAVAGLHPDRAPTIVAGIVILLEVLEVCGLQRVTVSDRDILWGVALDSARSFEASPR
jgi:exopolyphosphatase/guanosine-5'-triphosphate,3'-diphosphate pyrophosphatase